MTEVLAAAVVLGSVYALLGAAVALVSIATRTLHLAIGEILVVGVLLQLIASAEFVSDLPAAVAVPGAVAAGAFVAAGLEPLVLRWFVAPVHRLVGLAVAAGVIQSLTVASLGARTYRPAPLFDLPAVATIPGEVWTAVVLGVPGALLIAAALRWTRWGRRVRITGGSERAARRSGFSPRWSRATALAVSGGAAVVAGLLVSPVTFVGAASGPAFTVRGVAAALLLGHVGPTLAVVAGLGLGLVDALAASAWPGAGGELAVAVVVVAVMVVRGSDEARDWGRAW